jgi:DNA-binding response OmpR family regulator
VISEDFALILINISNCCTQAVEFYTKLGHRTFVPCIFIYRSDSDLEILSSAGLSPSSLELCRRPFDPEDLYRQIRSVLVSNTAENGGKKHKLIILGHLCINEAAHIVTYGAENVELTKKEFELLRFLTLRHGNALSREEIFVKVWGFNYYGDTNVVDVYIRYLRSKLDQRFGVKLIQTVRGVGYMIG